MHRFSNATRSWEPVKLSERHILKVNDLVRLPIHVAIPTMEEPLFYTDDHDFVFWRVVGITDTGPDGIPQLMVKPVQWFSRDIH